jgi:ABC-2 type transport system permease protein
MSLATQTWLHFRRKMLEMARQPVWIFAGLSSPLLYLALFAPLLQALAGSPGFAGSSVLDVFVPGIVVLMAFGAGMGAGWVAIAELDGGVLERLTVTPTSRLALLLGTVLRDAVWLVIPAVLVMAVAVPFGYRPQLAGSIVLLALAGLWTATVSAVSGALGIKLGQIGSLAAIVTGLQLPLMLLSGILLPLSIAPAWMQLLAHVDPMYYAVEASRVLSTGTVASSTVGVAFAVLGALAVASIAWATSVYERALG